MNDLDGNNHVPDLTQVIYNFLDWLEDYGWLMEISAGHIYYSKFIVLDPDSIYEMRFVPTSMPEYNKIES